MEYNNFGKTIIIKTLQGDIIWDGPIINKFHDILFEKIKTYQYQKNNALYWNIIDDDGNIYKFFDLYYNKEVLIKHNNFTVIINDKYTPIIYDFDGPRDNGCRYDGSFLN